MSDIYLSLTETPSVVTLSQPVIASSVAATVTVGNTVTVALDANSLSALENVTVTVGAAISGTVTVANFPASQTVQGTVTVGSLPAISGSVTVNNFPSTQTIAGTVTANGGNFLNADNALITKDSASNIVLVGGLNYSATPTQSAIDAIRTDGDGAVVVYSSQTNWTDTNAGNQPRSASQQTPFPVQILGGSVTIGSLPAISGTVTVGNSVTIGSFATSVTARLINPAGTAVTYAEVGTAGSPSIDVLSVQGVSGGTSLPISGTAGSLTTRFGSVTTAGTAQISSAVTNASRRYLLIQNVTTSSNVITVGIGFTPTTTQGIQLSAGAGITFESSYIPTGAVYILSSVTASPFTILEA